MFYRISVKGQVLIKGKWSKENTFQKTICFLCEKCFHTIQIKVFYWSLLFSFNSIKRKITEEQLLVLQEQKPALSILFFLLSKHFPFLTFFLNSFGTKYRFKKETQHVIFSTQSWKWLNNRVRQNNVDI